MNRLIKKLEYFGLKCIIYLARRGLDRSKKSPLSCKEIIWIFGPSSIGKKSLMFRLANSGSRHSNAAKIFDISASDLVIPVVIPSRTRGKSEAERSEVVLRRIDALKAIYMSELNAKWIVHMQAIDLRENIAAKIVSAFPQVKSKCFYLGIDEEKYLERCKRTEISYGQAYMFREDHLTMLGAIFGRATEINL